MSQPAPALVGGAPPRQKAVEENGPKLSAMVPPDDFRAVSSIGAAGWEAPECLLLLLNVRCYNCSLTILMAVIVALDNSISSYIKPYNRNNERLCS